MGEIFSSGIAVAGRVLMLFIMIGVGYVCGKKEIITQSGSSQMSNLLITVVTPCVIVNAFASVGDEENFKNMGLIAVMAFLYHFIAIAVSMIFFRKEDENKKRSLRYCTIFSNCGYMGLPLIQAVLGEEALIYGSIFIAIFHFFAGTYGILLMRGKDGKVSVVKALINPGTIGIAFGIPIMLLGINIPSSIGGAINSLATLNTPIAMIIIGGNLSRIDLKQAVKQKQSYIASLVSLVIVPLCCIPVMYLLGFDDTLFAVGMIQISAPVAAASVLFSNKFKRDATVASQTMAISTILSILTMPVFIVFAQNINTFFPR